MCQTEKPPLYPLVIIAVLDPNTGVSPRHHPVPQKDNFKNWEIALYYRNLKPFFFFFINLLFFFPFNIYLLLLLLLPFPSSSAMENVQPLT